LVVGVGTPAGYRRAFLRRVLDVRRVPPAWWLAVAAVGVGPGLLAAVVLRPFGDGGVVAPAATTGAALLGAVGFAAAAGLAEEPGWRGVAQDGFGRRHGQLRAAVGLGVLWSCWHLPLYVLDGTYQSDLGIGTAQFWASMLARVPLAVLLVWVVVRTRGAVVAAVVAHALGNATGEMLVDDAATGWVQLALLAGAGLAVAVLGRGVEDDDGRVRRSGESEERHG
jgi:uncharacterized protein